MNKVIKATIIFYIVTFVAIIILFNVLNLSERMGNLILLGAMVAVNGITSLVLPRIYKDKK